MQISLQNSGGKEVFLGGSMEPPLGSNGSKSTFVTYVLINILPRNLNIIIWSELHKILSLLTKFVKCVKHFNLLLAPLWKSFLYMKQFRNTEI